MKIKIPVEIELPDAEEFGNYVGSYVYENDYDAVDTLEYNIADLIVAAIDNDLYSAIDFSFITKDYRNKYETVLNRWRLS